MIILKLVIELLPCLLMGYYLGRYKPAISGTIASVLINFGVPISLMGLLLRSGLNGYLLEAAVMALLAIGLLIVFIRMIPRLEDLTLNRTLMLGSAFGNSGYFGIPVALLFLPSEALIFSIGYDFGATLLIWSLGPILLHQNSAAFEAKDVWLRFQDAFMNSPASKGLAGALLIQLIPWKDQITSAIWIPSRILILLALLIVGMRLSGIVKYANSAFKDFMVKVKPYLFLKLIILPSLMLVLCSALGLPMLMRNALVLQAATPTAISVLLLAEGIGKDQELASALVFCSTLLAIITVPIWSAALQY